MSADHQPRPRPDYALNCEEPADVAGLARAGRSVLPEAETHKRLELELELERNSCGSSVGKS